ncbi:MAG: helix-turn-helix transcriptional regulator [Lentisphaeria bacterium]|nr:helix-turn-helix transcriptional regulator [Lentisphaeria bacterium]
MIIFQKKNQDLFWRMDFRLVNAFVENTSYDRFFKLPFNIISCRCEAEDAPESFIRNERTGECFHARSNQLLFIPSGLPMFIHRRADFFCYDLHFTLEHWPGRDLFSGLENIMDLSSQFKAAELKSIFAESDPRIAAARMRSFVFRISASILPETREQREWRFLPLTRKVRDTVSAEWSVARMAEEAHMSQGAFSREFSANMGCTARQFLQKELLLKALSLLGTGEKTVQAVAGELHFSSPFYFSKFFRKAYGMPPSEYVKSCTSRFGPGK